MLTLSDAQLAQILGHIRLEAPNEACGLLAGVEEYVARVLPAANIAANPRVEYLMDPHDQLRHFQAIEDQKLELLAIYHSHPSSPAYPSPKDLDMAYYPEVVYGIISLVEGEAPVLRAFRIVGGRVSEVPFQVVAHEMAGSQPESAL
jgi:proteasome lid subunit RPN8/RPN11